MVSGVLDEKKSIPDAHKLSDYGRDSDPKPAGLYRRAVRATDFRRSRGVPSLQIARKIAGVVYRIAGIDSEHCYVEHAWLGKCTSSEYEAEA